MIRTLMTVGEGNGSSYSCYTKSSESVWKGDRVVLVAGGRKIDHLRFFELLDKVSVNCGYTLWMTLYGRSARSFVKWTLSQTLVVICFCSPWTFVVVHRCSVVQSHVVILAYINHGRLMHHLAEQSSVTYLEIDMIPWAMGKNIADLISEIPVRIIAVLRRIRSSYYVSWRGSYVHPTSYIHTSSKIFGFFLRRVLDRTSQHDT